MPTLKAHVTLVDEEKGRCFYDELEDVDPSLSTGDLYQRYRRLFGRPCSGVYVDRKDGTTWRVGWTFVKHVEREDADRLHLEGRERSFLQTAWVCPVVYKPAVVESVNLDHSPLLIKEATA